MTWPFKKRRIIASVYWDNHKGQTRSVQKKVVTSHKNNIIVLFADGRRIEVRVEL